MRNLLLKAVALAGVLAASVPANAADVIVVQGLPLEEVLEIEENYQGEVTIESVNGAITEVRRQCYAWLYYYDDLDASIVSTEAARQHLQLAIAEFPEDQDAAYASMEQAMRELETMRATFTCQRFFESLTYIELPPTNN